MLKKTLGLTGVAVALFLLYGLTRQLYDVLHAGKRLDEAINELGKLQAENRNLKRKLEEVKSISFIEGQLRDNLNLARPEETVVIIHREAIEQILGAKKRLEEVVIPNWKGWLKLFWR